MDYEIFEIYFPMCGFSGINIYRSTLEASVIKKITRSQSEKQSERS